MKLQKPNYKAWLIDLKDYPASAGIQEKIKFLSGFGILAPSQHNTQPWHMDVKGNMLTIKPDNTRNLPVGDPTNFGLYMSLGACIENICQAAAALGFDTKVTITEKQNQIAFKDPGTFEPDVQVLNTIKKRHSNKAVYQKRPIPPQLLKELSDVKDNQVELALITEPQLLMRCIELHTAAAKKVASNPAFVHELVSWLRINSTRAHDGMPGFVTGSTNPQSIIGKVLLRKKPELLARLVQKDKDLLQSASMIAIWGTNDHTAEGYIKAGMLIERFWLKLVKNGLVGHPMVATISEEDANKKIKSICKLQTKPVFLMRVGYNEDKNLRTPRRQNAISNRT